MAMTREEKLAKKRAWARAWYSANKDIAALRSSAYRAANKERIKQASAEYRKANIEKIRTTQARHHLANKEKKNRASLEWQHRNRERMNAQRRSYYKDHREKQRVSGHAYRARQRQAHGRFDARDLDVLRKILGNRCLCCRSAESVTLDHIIPLAHGGSNQPTNLQPLCRRCNSSKAHRRRTDYRTLLQIRKIEKAFQLSFFGAT